MAVNTFANGLNKCQSCGHQILAAAADEQEEEEIAKSAFCAPKITLSSCSDVQEKNIYLVPRRTVEMLQSPLHIDRNSSFMMPKTRQLQSEPRRIKELLRSPLHQDQRSSGKLTAEAARNVASQPRRTKKSPRQPEPRPVKEFLTNHLKPQSSKKLFQSPIKPDLIDSCTQNIYSEPRRIRELVQSPLHKHVKDNHLKPSNSQSTKQNVIDPSTKNIYSEPRRIKELLQSPLHKDMRVQMLGKASKNNTKDSKLLPSVEQKQNVKTPSSHLIKPISNIYSEPRRIKELLQSPLHKDMRATMLARSTKSIYSEPDHTKELLSL